MPNRTGLMYASAKTQFKHGGHDRAAVQSILISERRLKRRVRELAGQIERDFAGGELVVVSLLNGTIMFLADLIRNLNLPLRLDFIGVSSYRIITESHDL